MRKSRLSLAAIAALGITTASLSASNLIDIKLPDDKWKFIGVNGGFTESIDKTVVSIPSTHSQEITETIDDNKSTQSSVAGTKGEMTFLVIDHSTSTEFTSAKMSYSTANHLQDGSYQVPEMYVYVENNDGNRTPDIRIKYQGDYEGEDFYLTLGENIYKGTYESGATYTSAQALIEYSIVSTSTEYKEENLTIAYVFDKNIANNPSKPGFKGSKNDYTYSSNHNSVSTTVPAHSGVLKIYHYNAASQSWDTYVDANGTIINSDFTSLEKGKGYWVKFEDGSDANDSGLILGDTGITSSDYNESELTAGWNMLSFNDTSLIATGSTGMLVELGIMADNNYTKFTITDTGETESFDFNSTYYMSLATDTNKSKIVQQFNKQFAQAQAYGTLSRDFNVRAYSNGINDLNITLISDKKFRIKDNGNNYSIGNVTTLGGQALYVPSLGTKAASGADINTTAVESVYGEYALGLRIPTEINNTLNSSILAALGIVSVGIGENNTTEADSTNQTSVSDMTTAIAGLATSLSGINLDTDFNGEADTVLLVNTSRNFSVRDKTFVKTYAVDTSVREATNLILDVNQSGVFGSIDLNESNTSALTIAKEIRGDTTYVEANGTNGYIFVATNNHNNRSFTLEQSSGINRLRLITDSTENNASGAVKQVYSLENLARAEVNYNTKAQLHLLKDNNETEDSATNNYVEFNITNSIGEYMNVRFGYFTDMNNSDTTVGAHEYNLSYGSKTIAVGYIGNDLNISVVPITDLNSTEVTTAADIWTKAINHHFSEINSSFTISASASAGVITLDGDFNFTIDQNGSSKFDFNISDSTSSALITDSNLTIDSITSDLKYNKVYAGAVTTDIDSAVPMIQKVSGKKVRKILSTNEKLSDGSISWNFIDLTKSSDKWFNAQDQYSLFSFDKTKGYWVYLEEEDVPAFKGDLNLTVDLQYDHKFTNDTNDSTSKYNYTTTNVVRKGTITVDISDIADSSAIDRAVAKVGNHKITLAQSGNTYTADFSEYELGSLGDKNTTDINVTFFTTDSFTKTISLAMDNSAPTRPVMNPITADLTSVTFTSSADVVLNIYSGDINDSSPASGGTLIETNVTFPYNLCAAATNFSTNLGSYRVIAIDKDSATSKDYPNNIDYNRVSDIGYLDENNYSSVIYPIYKNASILKTTSNSTDSIPKDFDSSCETLSTANASDHGVELIGIDGIGDVIVAFEKNTSLFATIGASALRTVTLDVNGSDVAKLRFDGDHYQFAGQKFLMFYKGAIYSTGWNDLNNSDGGTAYFTDSNITMLKDQTIVK